MIDVSRLDPRPAGFPACGECAYRDTGTPQICFACASTRMTPVPEDGCEICRHPTKKDENCGNPICNWGGDRYFERSYSIGLRSGGLQMAIGRYKYQDRKAWAVIFARLLVAYLDENRDAFSGFDLIVASPTYVSTRGNGRRWDHTRLVLQEAARIPTCRWPFDLETPPAIEKSSYTAPMASRTWKERWRISEDDLSGALRVPDRKRTRGKRILVYDDVFTDGLTLRQVARCLKEDGGASRVSTLTLARQIFRGKPTPSASA